MFHSLFPTLIYHDKLKKNLRRGFNSELAQEARQFRQIDHQGKKWSQENYPGGYTSYGSIDNLDKISSSFEELEKMIRPHVIKFSQQLELDVRKQDLKLASIWLNIMGPNVTHTMHMHPLSVISGTYYVQTPPQSAALKFEDPRLIQFMSSPPRKTAAKKDNQRFFSISPAAGSLILFESWLKHEVPPNKSKDERISISFNYDWRG